MSRRVTTDQLSSNVKETLSKFLAYRNYSQLCIPDATTATGTGTNQDAANGPSAITKEVPTTLSTPATTAAVGTTVSTPSTTTAPAHINSTHLKIKDRSSPFKINGHGPPSPRAASTAAQTMLPAGTTVPHPPPIFSHNTPLNEKLVDLFQSQSGSIKFSAANGEDMSSVAEEEMAHLIMFVLNHQDGSVLFDLKQILVPIISFMFCDFWLLGFEAVAKRLFTRFHDVLKQIPESRTIFDRMARSIITQQLDSALRTSQGRRITIILRADSLDALLNYLKTRSNLCILQIINQHIDLEIDEPEVPSISDIMRREVGKKNILCRDASSSRSSSRPPSPPRIRKRRKSSCSTTSVPPLALSPPPGEDSSSVPTVEHSIALAKKEEKELIDAIKNLSLSYPCLPSIGLLSLYSNYSPTCCAVEPCHMQYVAIGFENSSIHLWDLQDPSSPRLDFGFTSSPSESGIYTLKRDLSQLNLGAKGYFNAATDPSCKDDALSINNEVNLMLGEDEAGVRTKSSSTLYDSKDTINMSQKRPKRPIRTSLRGHGGPVYGLTFLPNTDLLLSASEDTTVKGWSISLGKSVAVYKGHTWPVTALDASSHGHWFATVSTDKTARLWCPDRLSPVRIFPGHTQAIHCVKFHPNSQYFATGSCDTTIRMYDVMSGRVVRSFVGHQASVLNLDFSPDGQLVASVGEDLRVKIWDIASGKQLREFRGHTAPPYGVSFNADGSILATCGLDATLKLWNMSRPEKGDVAQTQASDTLATYPLKMSKLIHAKFMPNNWLLTIGTKGWSDR